MEDLRFFHHFLVTAYPPVPAGAYSVWQDMAAMAHEVSYLRWNHVEELLMEE
jgi:hypothetical protein